VNDFLRVQIRQALCYLNEEIAGHFLAKSSVLLSAQDLVELALSAKFQQQVNCLCVLEMSVQPQDIRMLELALDLNLHLDLIDQIAVNHFVLPHALERIDLVGVLALHLLHDAEGTLAKTLLCVEELETI
jgi:hypothetical protein